MFHLPVWRGGTLWLLSALVILSSPASAQDTHAPRSEPVLIKAGRLLNVRSGTYSAHQCVLVERGRIRAVGGPAVCARAPKNATVIDLSRVTVLPGLIDAHSHLFSANEGRQDATADMTEAQRLEVALANAREYVEAGFTTVRNLGYGIDGDVHVRDRIRAGRLRGPRVLAATRKLTPPGGQGVTPDARPEFIRNFAQVRGVQEARQAVRENVAAGADVIKVVVDVGPRLLSTEEVGAIVEEAHRARRRVAAHATSEAAVRVAVDAGVDSVEHGTEASEEVLQRMRERGIFLVPTSFTEQALRDIFAGDVRRSAEAASEFEAFVAGYQRMAPRRLQRALKAGVRIAAGSDMIWRYPSKTRGQAALVNLEALHADGLSAAATLRAATIEGAELLGVADQVGSIEAGKAADIIAVDGDPLANLEVLKHVSFVMRDGVVIKRLGTTRPQKPE